MEVLRMIVNLTNTKKMSSANIKGLYMDVLVVIMIDWILHID